MEEKPRRTQRLAETAEKRRSSHEAVFSAFFAVLGELCDHKKQTRPKRVPFSRHENLAGKTRCYAIAMQSTPAKCRVAKSSGLTMMFTRPANEEL
jgi:hypothetical protein